MKGLLLASLALSASALAVALTRPAASAGRGSTPAVAAPQESPTTDDDGPLERTLADLRAQLDDLEARVLELETRPAALPARQPVAVEEESDEELEALRRLAAALDDPAAAEGTGLESLVLNVVETREARARAEAEARRQEFLLQRIEDRIARLAPELGLNDAQTRDLRRVLTDQELRRDEFFSKMREDGTFDRETIRTEMRTLRESTLAELQTFLTPDQLDRYQELDRRRNPFGPPNGDRRNRSAPREF